jgi:uncharacterized membrane protein YgcG
MNVQSPEILSDLYRDLRDRRLLPLIILLVAAMVVIPLALSSSPKKIAPAATPQVSAPAHGGSSLTATQVTILDPGVRDYRRRLRSDAAKDPFVQRFGGGGSASSGGSSASSTSASTGGSSSAGLTQTSSGSAPLTAEGQAASAAANSGSSSAPSTGSLNGNTSAPSTSSPSPTTQNKYFFYRVKVKTGPVGGKMEVRDNVKAVTSLPDNQVPALAFLGVQTNSNFGAQKAIFIVNSSVSLVSGNGECSLAGTQCQLVTLTPGDHADLTWSDGATYRVTLVKFDLVSRSGTPGSGGGSGRKGGSQQQRVSGWNGPSGQHFSF